MNQGFINIFFCHKFLHGVIKSNQHFVNHFTQPYSEDHHWEKHLVQEDESRVFTPPSEDDAPITFTSSFPWHLLELHFNEKEMFEGT